MFFIIFLLLIHVNWFYREEKKNRTTKIFFFQFLFYNIHFIDPLAVPLRPPLFLEKYLYTSMYMRRRKIQIFPLSILKIFSSLARPSRLVS